MNENTAVLISCPCAFPFDPKALAAFTPAWREAHDRHHSKAAA